MDSKTQDDKKFSMDNYLDKKLKSENTDGMSAGELFDAGFGVYVYPNGIFLKLEMDFYVKTTCPVNGSEDIIEVHVEYRCNRYGNLIEHHSFLKWVDTFEEKGFGLEATADTIYERIDQVVQPTQLLVKTKSHSNYRSFNYATREKAI